MRILSLPGSVLYSLDDAGQRLIEEDSHLLAVCAPKSAGVFHSTASMTAEGRSVDGSEMASWALLGPWPEEPIFFLSEGALHVAQTAPEHSLGIKLWGIWNLPTRTHTDLHRHPRHHGLTWSGGCLWVQRPDALWCLDFGQDAITVFPAPGTTWDPVLGEEVVETELLGGDFDDEPLRLLQAIESPEGQGVLVGTSQAVELLWRGNHDPTWSRPWVDAPLTPLEITSDAAHRWEGILSSASGGLFGLVGKSDQLAVCRTPRSVDIQKLVSALPSAAWVSGSTALPAVFWQHAAQSEVPGTELIGVWPRLRQDMRGALYLMTSRAILRWSDPQQPEQWSVWVGIQGDDFGLPLRGALVPTEGTLLDLAFDASVPGVLFRQAEALGATYYHSVLLYDGSFRTLSYQSAKRTLSEGIPILCTGYTTHPRSALVNVGRTPSSRELP